MAKKTNKVLALILALCIVFSMSLPVFADCVVCDHGLEKLANELLQFVREYGEAAYEKLIDYLHTYDDVAEEQYEALKEAFENAKAVLEGDDEEAKAALVNEIAELLAQYLGEDFVNNAYAALCFLYEAEIYAEALAEDKDALKDAVKELVNYLIEAGYVTEEEITDVLAGIKYAQTLTEEEVKAYAKQLLECLYKKAVDAGYVEKAQEVVDEYTPVVKEIAEKLAEFAKLSEEEVLELLLDAASEYLSEDELAAIADFVAELKDLIENFDCEATKEELKAAVLALAEEALEEIKANPIVAEILSYVELAEELGIEDLDDLVEYAKGLLELYYEISKYLATHVDYAYCYQNYYVALGADTPAGTGLAYPAKSYVDLVAEALCLSEDQYNNLATDEFVLGNSVDYIKANAAEIAKANLITYEVDAMSVINAILNADASAYVTVDPEFKAAVEEIFNKTVEVLEANWAELAGKTVTEIAVCVQNKVAKIVADVVAKYPCLTDYYDGCLNDDAEYICEMVINYLFNAFECVEETKDNVVVAVASVDWDAVKEGAELVADLAVGCVEYALDTYAAIEAIRAINPDAALLYVGLYNPFQGVKVNVGGETIDLGAYFDYVIEATDFLGLANAMITGEVVYVAVPDTAIDEVGEISLEDLLNVVQFANGEGHEYIAEQILGALDLPLYGDANCDGIVNTLDAVDCLMYDARIYTADDICFINADVNDDHVVNTTDALYILEYDARVRTLFPIEMG